MFHFNPPLNKFEKRVLAVALPLFIIIGLVAGYGYEKLLLGTLRI